MTDLRFPHRKSNENRCFEARVMWVEGERSLLNAHHIKYPVFTEPAQTGEAILDEQLWCPEQLLVAALANAWLNRYRVLAVQAKLPVRQLQCEAIGEMESVNDRMLFTTVHAYPKITLLQETDREIAASLMASAQEDPLIAAVDVAFILHGEILVEPPAGDQQLPLFKQ